MGWQLMAPQMSNMRASCWRCPWNASFLLARPQMLTNPN